MENVENEILDSNLNEQGRTRRRRRELLPWWIKIFTWIFMITGFISPIGLVFGILGYPFHMSFYGLETNYPLSFIGLFLITSFLLKGVTALSLWTERDWAITLGQIDAILGISICVFSMFVYPFVDNISSSIFNIRLELLLIIPYLIKLRKIKYDWMEAGST